MPLRRRVRQVLVELVSAVAECAAAVARRIGLDPRRLVVDARSDRTGDVRYEPLLNVAAIPPVAPVYVDERSRHTGPYRAMHADWGAPTTLPAGLVTVNDARVSMPTGIHRWRNRIFSDGLLGGETMYNPKYLAAFAAMMVVGSMELAEGVLLGLPWNHNIYHWLIEMLPRMHLVEELPELQHAQLLVPASAPSFVPESLRLAGLDSRVTYLDDGVYRVGTLHIPSRLAAASDVSPDAIKWLDDRFPQAETDAPNRRLYVSRGDAPVRYVANERDVRTMLEDEYGFETLVMSTLPFEEQVRAFREASMIVGAHGAAFAHLAFAPAGAKFVELFQDGHFNHCYGHMAAIRGIDYGFLVGERDALGLRVDLASLRDVVERMQRDEATGRTASASSYPTTPGLTAPGVR